MTLTDLIAGCWAIRPDTLLEIQSIYATHLRGEKIDIAAIEARLGRPLLREEQRYSVERGGVGVLQVSGVIAPKANLFMQVSGGMSLQQATRQIESAIADTNVKSLVIAADTPGGNVLGVPEFAETVKWAAAQKPVVTHTDGQLASAGYWFGAAANGIYISGPVVQVGSIGVVVTRNYNPNSAVKEEHITAGRYKRIALSNEPLSADSRAIVQADVDYVYSLFVDAVAANRGVSVDNVLEHMADGRVFRGQQAIDAGLVDGVSTLDDLIEALATDPSKFASRRKARIAGLPARPKTKTEGTGVVLDVDPSTSQGSEDMEIKDLTREQLEAGNPALFAALRTEFTAAGARQEIDRRTGVLAASLPGHEALIAELANDGKTTAGEAALKVTAAAREAHEKAAAAHRGDAPAAAAGAHAPAPKGGEGGDKGETRAQQAAKVEAYMKEHPGTDVVAACKALGIAS